MATTNLGKVVGDSAYEVAVSQGYVGTESEWLASLHGANGEDGAPGEDGFSPSAEVVKTGSVATITITDKDGTTTASIYDGANGTNGTDGADGFSPIANVVKTGSVATITITDSIGTTTASVYDGSVATLSAGTGIDITGDTISNIAPYSDTAVASFISTKFGMANNSTGQYLQNSVITDTTGGTASLTWYYPIEIRPDLEVYTRESGLINPALVGTIATNDWTVNDDTITASLTSTDGQYSFEVYNSTAWTITYPPSSHFDLVLRFYAGTYSVVPLQADFLPIDDSTIKVNGSGNIYAVAPTFTESDPIFAASAAATITASDISNWNSIVGVPTASASDEGKALVVSDSSGTIGWGTVGGGGRVVILNSKQYMAADDIAFLESIWTNWGTMLEPAVFFNSQMNAYYNIAYFNRSGSAPQLVFLSEPVYNKSKDRAWQYYKIEVNYNSAGKVDSVNVSSSMGAVNTYSAGTGISIYQGAISVENPVPTTSTASAGDVLTISGGSAVWAAPAGGSSLTVSGGANISVNTVSDVATVSLADSITLTSSDYNNVITLDDNDGHTTGMNGDNIVMIGTEIPEGEEEPYDKWVNEISDDYINLQYRDWNDGEGSEQLLSEVMIVSEDANITVADYDINGDDEEYNPFRTTMSSGGYGFYINDGNGTEHESRLWMDTDGSLVYTLDGNNHVLYNGGGM